MTAIFTTFGSAYQSLVGTVVNSGVDAAPRGQAVRELKWPYMWHISNPQAWELFIPGRRLNPFFALAEVIWMWTGKGGAEFIQFYNKSILQFLDDGMPYFHGSYGRRTRKSGYDESPLRPIPSPRTQPGPNGSIPVSVDQLQHVIDKIRADSDTRQAVVTLWDPIKDNLVQSKDHPCNNVIFFLSRNGRLNMTVVRRSNDLVLGVPYNMCQFSHLQALMAGSLELEQGSYTVMANNLHYYTEKYNDVLETVTCWYYGTARENLDSVPLSMPVPGMDTWTLDLLDAFVRSYWEPFEQASRNHLEEPGFKHDCEAYYSMQYVLLDTSMEQKGVPEYWRQVFRMLVIFHASKAGAWSMVDMLLEHVNRRFLWMVLDWWHFKKAFQHIFDKYETFYNDVSNNIFEGGE